VKLWDVRRPKTPSGREVLDASGSAETVFELARETGAQWAYMFVWTEDGGTWYAAAIPVHRTSQTWPSWGAEWREH
jgi:hypothetical protein